MPRVYRYEVISSRKHEPPRADHALTGDKWTRFRRRWLMHQPWCQRCGLAGEQVHHIQPRSVAPHRVFDLTNLETLCRACHEAHHAADKKPRF